MEGKSDRKYDLILWGATGFTGRLVFEYLSQNAPKGFKWAIGGRNKTQLETIRTKAKGAEDVDIVIADSMDQKSVEAMVQQCRVIISTVGPFLKYGTPLVDACVKYNVDYIDSTGESPWVFQMIQKHHETTKKNGTLIVPMCGFDSIPADLGVFHVQKEVQKTFKKKADSIYSVVEMGNSGPSGGTIASMLNLVEDSKAAKLIANPLALAGATTKNSRQKGGQKFIGYDSQLQRWTLPFVMESVNTQVVQRSNYLLDYGKDNFAYSEVMASRTFIKTIIFYFVLAIFLVLAKISFTREHLVKKLVPKPGEGPSEEVRRKSFFNYHYFADVKGEKGRKYIGTMTGGDAGYTETAKMLAESGLCLATQRDVLPIGKEGGVVTPAVAMGEVLLERLDKAGLSIKVLSDKIKKQN